MRKLLLLLGISALLLCAVPAAADEARDYIDDEVEEWNQVVENNGYITLGTYVGLIGEESVSYVFDLAPGTYHFYGSGGLHITDLDAFAYDEEGEELDSDTLGDKIPILVFKLNEGQEVKVEGLAFAFTEGFDEGYFCFLATCEDEGEIYSVSGGPSDIAEEPLETEEGD